MSKLKINKREIGSVCIFDLVGDSTQEGLQEVAWKIQRNIRRHRLQRVILNLQLVPALEPLGLRKLLTACLRPQRSLIYGVSDAVALSLEDTYVPRNVRICHSEKDVAEDFGPFLLERDKSSFFPELAENPEETIGYQLERRRSKRMHVALPIEVKLFSGDQVFETKAIATNISEGGLYAKYLDLEAIKKLEHIEPFEGMRAEIHIFPSANFPEEYHLQGRVNRRQIEGRQLGIALEFVG